MPTLLVISGTDSAIFPKSPPDANLLLGFWAMHQMLKEASAGTFRLNQIPNCSFEKELCNV